MDTDMVADTVAVTDMKTNRESDTSVSMFISICRTSILRTSNCITGINGINAIYNPFVKLSIVVSGVPNVRNGAHAHVCNGANALVWQWRTWAYLLIYWFKLF